MHRYLVAALVMLSVARPSFCQTWDRLQMIPAGVKIDGLQVGLHRVQGPLVGADATIVIDAGECQMRVLRGRVAQSDRRRPGERGWIARHPGLFGALLGAGAGAVTGYALGQDCSHDGTSGSCSSKGGASVVGAGLGAGGGALVGLLLGRK